MTRVYWILAIVFTLAATLASFWLYTQLPNQVPIHWNIQGQVDGYGSKTWALFLMPAVMAGMMALFALLPWLSPKRYEVSSFRSTTLYVMVVVIGLFGAIHAIMLYTALHGGRGGSTLLIAVCMLAFVLMGNVLGKLRPNFYMGVRTPWTLASERVWADTHRLAAWLFVVCGIVGFVFALLGWPIFAFVAILVAAFVTILYSLIHYKQLERRGEL
jgi:uncharacterized membrane protein